MSQLPEGVRSWSSLGPINDNNILNTGMELLGLLAQHHATGEGIGLKAEMLHLASEGHLLLGPTASGRPPSDLFSAGVLMMQRMFEHRLPQGVSPHRLMPFINALVPPLPPSVPYLLEELLTPDQTLRPSDALGPYQRWAQAAAHEDLRYHAPARYTGSWTTVADTHVGRGKMLQQQTNQDALFHGATDNMSLLVVADGISESDVGSGDMASRIFVDVARSMWRDGSPKLPSGSGQEFLVELMRRANQAIAERSLALAGGDLGGRIPIGTTAVVALCRGDQVEIACMGDSRAYLVTPCGAGVLTADQNARLQGLLNNTPVEDEIADALVGYVGHLDEKNRPTLLPVWYRRLRVLPNECLVLCSDGIHDFAGPNHLRFIRNMKRYIDEMTLQDAAAQLVQDANNGGGGDNATVVVAQLNKPHEKKRRT